jgi:DNA-binding HxlR family transcriptional regulator
MDDQPACSIARSLEVLGERWTLLVLRDAFSGVTRFSEFRDSLAIAPDVLTERLTTLVEAGALSREPYQDPGARVRHSYHLTRAGEELLVVLGALQQWGDDHLPRAAGPTVLRQSAAGRPLHVGFVDDRGTEVELAKVELVRTAAYPSR